MLKESVFLSRQCYLRICRLLAFSLSFCEQVLSTSYRHNNYLRLSSSFPCNIVNIHYTNSSIPVQDLLSDCSGVRQLTQSLLLPSSPRSHVGIYGNSNPLLSSQWVPILNNSPPVPENQVCLFVQYRMIIHVHTHPTSGNLIVLTRLC